MIVYNTYILTRGIPIIIIYKKSSYSYDNYYILFTEVSYSGKEEKFLILLNNNVLEC